MASATKLIVTQGVVVHNGATYRKGEHLTLPEDQAKRLLDGGVCAADDKPAKSGNQKPAEGGK